MEHAVCTTDVVTTLDIDKHNVLNLITFGHQISVISCQRREISLLIQPNRKSYVGLRQSCNTPCNRNVLLSQESTVATAFAALRRISCTGREQHELILRATYACGMAGQIAHRRH